MSENVTPVFGPTNPKESAIKVERFGCVIGLKAEYEQQYRTLHADVWPAVLDRIKRSNIKNYSIYITEIKGEKYLFSYFEYVGDNLEKDLQDMALDEETQRWWKETDCCQFKLPAALPDENWYRMESVFLFE